MASDLTEDQKLVMLGLKSPNKQESSQSNAVAVFQENIANAWGDFQSAFQGAGLTSFDDFETWLTNNGVDATTASNIRGNIEATYSWSDYDSIVDDSTSWEGYKSNFRSGSGIRSDLTTEDGRSIAGLQVYERGGVGRDGQDIPEGGVEVYGREVHFSQSGAAQTPAEDQSDDPIAYSNLTLSTNVPILAQDVTITADVTNNTNIDPLAVVSELFVDGRVERSKTHDVAAGATETVSFTYAFTTFDTFEVTVNDLPEETVYVAPNQL